MTRSKALGCREDVEGLEDLVVPFDLITSAVVMQGEVV